MTVLPLTKRAVEERITFVLRGGKALTKVDLHAVVTLAFTLPWDQFEEVLGEMVSRGKLEIVAVDKEEKYRLKT